MKKTALLIPACLFFIISVSSSSKVKSKLNYPVLISFYKQKVPDSINEFLKVYFRIKGVAVLNDYSEVIQLWGDASKKKMDRLIQTKQFNKKEASDPQTFILPVANILYIQIFRDSVNFPSEYKIDSVRWKAELVLPFDTTGLFNTFKPSDKTDLLPYRALREFTDELITTKRLN